MSFGRRTFEQPSGASIEVDTLDHDVLLYADNGGQEALSFYLKPNDAVRLASAILDAAVYLELSKPHV